MNYFSYTPHGGYQEHTFKTDAQQRAADAIKDLALMNSTAPSECQYKLSDIVWGEISERAMPTSDSGHALKRQELVSYEDEYPQVIDGKMENPFGDLIQIKNIKSKDLLTHDVVLQIAVVWMTLSAKIKRFKGYALMEIMALADTLFEQHGVKRGGSEGNMKFKTYDGRYKLIVGIQKTMAFGPEIQAARQKMIAALDNYPAEADDLKSIVTTAFTQIDGQLRVAEILRLRNLQINNQLWVEGMEIVAESLRVESSKKQLRLYARNTSGDYIAIPLNIAAL